MSIAWIEKALVVVAFLLFLGAFKTMLLNGGDDRTGGSALFQLVSGSLYLASMIIVVARGFPPWGFTILQRAWPLALLTLLTLVSTLWSQDPGSTLRRAIALILSTWFAFYIVLRFNPRTFVNLLVIAFGVLLVVSILAAAVPGQGITPSGTYAGAWRGLTGNKNELGRVVALAVALLPAAALLGMTDRPRRAFIVGAAALPVLLLSHSATSLMAAVLGIVLGGVGYVLCGGRIGRVRLRAELRAILGVIAVVGGLALFTVAWTPLLTALGRDPTLTGRTKLWDWALTVNQDRHLLGSGYRSFWIDENTRYFFLAFAWNKNGEGERSDSFSGPTHAHSGYVDLILELGIVGLSIFIVTVLSGLVNLRRVVRRGNLDLGFIFAVIVAFLLIYAITARSILQQAEGLWVLFAIFYLFSIKESLFLEDKFKRSDVWAGA
jgi:O-antigen ligase